jgi:hypothetical protein
MKEGQYIWKYIPQQVGKNLALQPKNKSISEKISNPKAK